MKRQLLFLKALCLVLFMSCNNDDSQPAPETLQERIDGYLQQHQPSNQPGLSIAIRKDGQIVYQGNEGIARFSSNQSIQSDTQFRLGSISKPITALAIMKLVEDGMLNLNDKLLSFYPELPASFSDITIAHLLAHRSGLLDYIDDNNDVTALDNLNMQDALNFLKNPNSGFENLVFAPGTSGRYSNTGYVLLALVLEKVTGSTLPEYLDTHIFAPAGMSDTFVISEQEHLGDHGENYALSFGTNLKVKGFNSLIYGASGVVSTTSDMMRFVDKLLNYEIVTKESLGLMTATKGAVTDIETDYGYGWLTGTGSYWHSGRLTDSNDFWHPGGFDGYQTVLSINPDLNLEVIILSNGGNDTMEKMWDLLALTREHFKN